MTVIATDSMVCVRLPTAMPLVLTLLDGRAWWGWGCWERSVVVGVA